MKAAFSIGVSIIVFLSLLALCAPLISPYDPSAINSDSLLCSPSWRHLMGTDSLGRDLFSRIVFGARISLSIGIIAVGISTFIGVLLGSISGFYGGRIDSVIMRFVDIMLCFPTYFLLLAIVAVLDSSIFNIMVIIGLTSWMGSARLIRAEILSIKEREFIQAARAIGASSFRIIACHLIPNAIAPVVVSTILRVAQAILIESTLSFLGLGVQPPTPSWGNILMEAKATLGVAWWLTLYPGLFIFVTILSFILVGEGLRYKLRL